MRRARAERLKRALRVRLLLTSLSCDREGDSLGANLWPGNMWSADDWGHMLLPEIEKQQFVGKEVVSRADGVFGKPETYEKPKERGSPQANSTANPAMRHEASNVTASRLAAIIERETGPSDLLSALQALTAELRT